MRIAVCTLIALMSGLLAIGNACHAQDEIANATSAAIKVGAQSVVQIDTIGGVTPKGKSRSTSPFSGTVVSKDGLILTASYNLLHQPASIFVRLPDGDRSDQRVVAEVVARDESRNVTLLKIDRSNLNPIRFANMDELRVGQRVIAIGKSVSATEPNVSLGIVSAKDRIWSRATQTDAKISRLNYGGPLLGLDGSAVGILVPLSHSNPEVGAGDQWYDSGIGFAAKVDLESASFKQLLQGTPIKRGLAGITFEGADENADPAKLSFCLPSSPAGKAGLKVGDTILQADGQTINYQGQFKHVIGPMYAGETLDVNVDRDGDSLEFSIELAGVIDPYLEPEIGILLALDDLDKPIVDFVFPDSPAAKVLKAGDRLTAVNETKTGTPSELRQALSLLVVGEACRIGIQRKGQSQEVELKTRRQLANMPAKTPSRFDAAARDFESIEISVSEGANQCVAFVPKGGDDEADRALPSLLVWVPPPGPVNAKAMFSKFEKLCAAKDMLVLVPQSIDPNNWLPDEASVIAKAVERLEERVAFDRNRIAIAGEGPGGQMAVLTAFSNRALFRGVAAIGCELTADLPNLETRPSERLLMLVLGGKDNEESVQSFRDKGFSLFETADSKNGIKKAADWIDILDRL